MKKLSDIPKRNPFQVPDGYFEKLPGVIQARVAEKAPGREWSLSWGLALRYAIPAVLLVAAGIFWYRVAAPPAIDLQTELAQFKPEQLKEYMDHHDVYSDADVSTDDLVESVTWSTKDVDRLEKSVYSDYSASQPEIDRFLDEYDSLL